MSQQIQITGGAKVRNLEGVLTGTSGVVNALAINVPNGIPQLDGSGKILVSQLPNSVMEYKGTWDASTNTPTLADGTGNQGDVYLCNVAGTVNFGAGPITFFVGDQVIYSGTIWQRASGASGTVTSVAVTESGDSLTITGSPITTSGTINIGFAGTNLQYINGAGNLTTFPSLTGYVPYTGATANVDLGVYDLTADLITGARGSFASNGGSDTFAINHSSGGGIALNITKGGSGEGLYINKTSGSGNAATIIGTLEATTLVKSGGTSTQFLKADGSVDSSTYLTTSAASSTYVPYTGATASVDLGAYVLGGSELYSNGLGSVAGFIYLKQNTLISQYLADYSAIGAYSNGYVFNIATPSVSKQAKLDLSLISASSSRTFTLPDASGTLALLSADQTFTGINSFDYGINYKTGASLANVSGYISQAYAKSGTGAGSTLSLKISDGNSVKAINLDFVGSPATYTYTFPAASGTIALTSDLGSYLPLAGGIMTGSILLNNNLTISGQLFGTSSYASMLAMSPSDKVLIDNSGRGVIFGGTIGQGAYTYNFPSASGTFALTSDIPSLANYVTLTTTQTISGAKTFTSDLNAAKVAIANSNTLYTTTGYTTLSASNVGTTSWIAYVWGNVGGAAAILSFDNTAQYTYTFPAATGTLPLGTGTTNYHAKWTGTSTIGNSLIWDNGTNVGIGTTSPFAIAGLNLSLDNAASSAIQLGVSGVRNAQFYADGAEVRLYAVTNVPIKFGTNDTERMRITSSGNVGIGTSSPNNKLDVSGNTVLNGTVSFGTAAAAANSFTFYQNYSVGQPGTDWYSSTGAVIFGFNGNTKALFLGNLTGGATTLSTDASGNIIRTPSDINLKTNIEDLQYGLETIMQLRPIIHNWKESIDTEEKSINMGEGKSIGFIAQEVELLVPEIVCGDEYKSIDYPKMVAILTKAIQEQQIQIQNLQEQINILQNK